jgi:hypothetical protein
MWMWSSSRTLRGKSAQLEISYARPCSGPWQKHPPSTPVTDVTDVVLTEGFVFLWWCLFNRITLSLTKQATTKNPVRATNVCNVQHRYWHSPTLVPMLPMGGEGEVLFSTPHVQLLLFLLVTLTTITSLDRFMNEQKVFSTLKERHLNRLYQSHTWLSKCSWLERNFWLSCPVRSSNEKGKQMLCILTSKCRLAHAFAWSKLIKMT